jgi:hypothetical protein
MAETRKIIQATREITVNINGQEFDALLIPKNAMVEIDFSQFPEDDPLRRQANIGKMTKLELDFDLDIIDVSDGNGTYRLTKRGASRLLESL